MTHPACSAIHTRLAAFACEDQANDSPEDFPFMRFLASGALFGALLLSCSAFAQAPAASAPTPDALKAARGIVTQMQGDRANVLKVMSAPMIGLMQQMGIKEPDRAQVLVQEVVMPLLSAHYDELLDVQARAYATALTVADLQAISAFYATPAGHNLAVAQPTLAQAQVAGMTQWISTLAPELQTKLAQAIQTHGWGPAGKAK